MQEMNHMKYSYFIRNTLIPKTLLYENKMNLNYQQRISYAKKFLLGDNHFIKNVLAIESE